MDSSNVPGVYVADDMRSAYVPKVLVVDDDETLCRALERLLRSAGHTVETYTSPLDFLASSRRPAGSVVLLDVRMHELSGPEVMQELEEEPSLRIFFMSAADDSLIRRSVLAAGARGWFTKPIDGEALLAAIGAPAQKYEAR